MDNVTPLDRKPHMSRTYRGPVYTEDHQMVTWSAILWNFMLDSQRNSQRLTER